MSDDNHKPCRCLLREAGEIELAQSVAQYVSLIDPNNKADEELYHKRLEICRKCAYLLSGTCRKCGCYVEMRAAIKNNRCPGEERMW